MSQDIETIRPILPQGNWEKGSSSDGVYLSRASNAVFDIGSPSKFTVRVRFRPTASNVNNGLATRSSLSSAQGDWALGFFNGATMKPGFRVNNNGAAITSASAALTTGNWYFIEASYDSSLGSNNLKLFINGVLDTQGNFTTVISNNAVALNMGTYFDTTHGIIGMISEFEFCAGVVRNTASYTVPVRLVADANTTALWTFASAGVGADSSTNALNPTTNGSYPFGDLSWRKVLKS